MVKHDIVRMHSRADWALVWKRSDLCQESIRAGLGDMVRTTLNRWRFEVVDLPRFSGQVVLLLNDRI
jgi:hypothetical protein